MLETVTAVQEVAIADAAHRKPRDKLLNPKHWARKLFRTSRRLLLEQGLRQLSLQRHKSVLVVGAGHDPYRALFDAPHDYVCLDIEYVPGVTDVVASALDMPFEADRFDCVFATECLEHIADPFRFCQEMTRVLKPGGELVLTVPFLYHQHGDPYDFWRPTRQCLLDLLKDYESVSVQSLGNRWHVISDLLTTAKPKGLFVPLRLVNHLLARMPGSITDSPQATTAPTGFIVSAVK
jgi:SAM-dependent methyltransferase